MDPQMYEIDWQPDGNEVSPVRVNPVLRHAAERRKSLDGSWRFMLDPDDRGLKERWHDRATTFKDKIRVPGTWQGQGFGHDGPDYIWDFRVYTRTLRATWRGTAWYARTFRVPKAWRGLRVRLNFGGVMPSAEIWLNGEPVGSHSGPFVPFAFDVTDALRFSGQNTLVVRIFERNRWMGHSYNWGGLWSGLFRAVELTATGPVGFEQFAVHPDVDKQKLHVRVKTLGTPVDPLSVALAVAPVDGGPAVTGTHELAPGVVNEFELAVPSPRLWSPDAPNLYRIDAVLLSGGVTQDALSERVGFVKLGVDGKHFLINGEPYYLRGTGDFNANPETASPDTSRERWRRKLTTLREFGYNYVRCQSYVPAPEYYDVADEVGLIVQSEMGILGGWSGHSPWHRYGWPVPTPEWRDALRWQWNRTVMRDVNHPSALIYCMSNELGGDTPFPRVAWQCHDETKAIKPSAFILWTDGGCNKSLPGDFINAEASVDKETKLPVVQHEFRWWSAYPDVRTKRKWNGAVRPYAIEILEAQARRHGLQKLMPRMVHASQQLQYAESRLKMENCRRDNPTLAGISHFNIMDIGLSPQGIVDEFYDVKITDAPTWRRTNGDTVILMDRGFDDRIFTGGEVFSCTFRVSDFSHPPLTKPELKWRLTAGKKVVADGVIVYRHRRFRTCPAGRIRVELPQPGEPVELTLHATLKSGRRTFENEWKFWQFPKKPALPDDAALYVQCAATWLRTLRHVPALSDRLAKAPPSVLLSDVLDGALVEHARKGGRVVLAPTEGWLRPFTPKLGGGGYFWLPPANYPPLEDGHGGAIVSPHPMLGALPHEGFADFQFYRLIASAPPVDLEPLGLGKVQPVVRPLSTYFVCRPLGYLFEVQLGRGGLIVCALDLDQRLPEARYLLASILDYACGPHFAPTLRIRGQSIDKLLAASEV